MISLMGLKRGVEGIVTRPSAYGFAATLARLDSALERRQLTIFARFDHSSAARQVGLTMPDTQVVVFGNPRAGTPLMLASPLVALDLPLRVLVSDEGGHAVVSYLSPSYVAERYGIPSDLVKNIAGIEKIVDEVVGGAPVRD
jgi:uncharacterized protein (DUF302 family)